jgi:uncharacterized protein YndB with AHSA1/START domain
MQAVMKIERSVVVAAPQERVWKAITTPEHISKWFIRMEFDRLEVGQRVRYSWDPYPGMNATEAWGEITIVEPIERFGYNGQIEPPRPELTETVFVLKTVPEGTRITVTETGFEALPDGLRQKRYADNGGGWDVTLDQLAAYLNGEVA